jgi:hypothetical protein
MILPDQLQEIRKKIVERRVEIERKKRERNNILGIQITMYSKDKI